MNFRWGGFRFFKSKIKFRSQARFGRPAVLGLGLLAVGCLHSPDKNPQTETPNGTENPNATPVEFPNQWCYYKAELTDPVSLVEIYPTFNRHGEIIYQGDFSDGTLVYHDRVVFDESGLPIEKIFYTAAGDTIVLALESDNEGRITKILELSGTANYRDYDERGNIISRIMDIKDDGIPESVSLYTYTTFDSLATMDVYETVDSNNLPTLSESNHILTLAISYDENQRPQRNFYTYYYPELNYKDHFFFYNEDGIKVRSESDNDGDGTIDATQEFHGQFPVVPDYTYVLDDLGRVLEEIRPSGLTMSYEYDQMGRLTQIKILNNGVPDRTFSYQYSCPQE